MFVTTVRRSGLKAGARIETMLAASVASNFTCRSGLKAGARIETAQLWTPAGRAKSRSGLKAGARIETTQRVCECNSRLESLRSQSRSAD